MPVVFVHGVNNRAGDSYRDNEVGRNEFLREIVAPALGLKPEEVSIESPYWGGDGARFRWNMAVLPQASEKYEKFGGDEEALALERTATLVSQSPLSSGSIVGLAKSNLPEAIDLIYGAALAGTTDPEAAKELAKSYQRASQYAASNPDLKWIDNTTDDNFADVLHAKVRKQTGDESFGAGGVLDRLKEGVSRLVNVVPDVGTGLLGKLGRKKLNATVTRFAGDAFTYLAKRGTPGQEGPIVAEVLKGLRKAEKAKTASDNKLVVIAHSFGGEIVYDILTRFAPDLVVDCLITVGSQVGLFEEMKLYLASDEQIPPQYPNGKVPLPANLKRWLNVFDLNDVLSFRVEPIFDGAKDFSYDTGYSTLQAHSGYFLRPSFYTRLADRLTK